MALIAQSRDPAALLRQIKSAIDQRKIVTWSYNGQGDFTHSVDQWGGLAFLRPVVVDGGFLRLKFITQNNKPATRTVYAVYHGRFAEMLIKHFPAVVTRVEPTVNPATDENPVLDD